MSRKMTFADRILRFDDMLSCASLDLPAGFRVVNPFQGDQKVQVRNIAAAFYRKYYDDTHPRRLILGSSPARRGTAVIGVPFEDPHCLQEETGIFIDGSSMMKSSSGFLQDVITQYGGRAAFYANFYLNFVCPLGIARIGPQGNEVNCNYYDSQELRETLYPFIINTLRCQVDLGIDTSICYCLGAGQNFRFLSKINKEPRLFNTILPLEHPRFIVQYNPERKNEFVAKYLDILRHPQE